MSRPLTRIVRRSFKTGQTDFEVGNFPHPGRGRARVVGGTTINNNFDLNLIDRGIWVAGGAWSIGDVVTYGSYRFVRTADGTSGSTFDPADDWLPIDPMFAENPSLWGTANTLDLEFDSDTASLPSGWSWVNQGSCTYEARDGAAVIKAPTGSGFQLRMITRAIPSDPWEIDMCVSSAIESTTAGDNVFFGFVMRESGTGKNLLFRRASVSGAIVTHSTSNAFAGAANDSASFVSCGSGKQVLKIVQAGTHSHSFYYSGDGGHSFATIYSADVSGDFTTAPDEVGFVVFNNISLEAEYAMHWFRVR